MAQVLGCVSTPPQLFFSPLLDCAEVFPTIVDMWLPTRRRNGTKVTMWVREPEVKKSINEGAACRPFYLNFLPFFHLVYLARSS